MWLLALLFILLPGQAQAKNSGVSEGDMNLSSAGNNPPSCGVQCHDTTAGGSITISFSPNCKVAGNCFTTTTGIQITVTTTSVPGDETLIGIGLFNNDAPYPLNIKEDGWSITADPNSNPTAYNYNQFSDGRDRTETWTVDAPTTQGTYYMEAHARHGMGANPRDQNITTAVATLIIDPPSSEFPLGAIPLGSMSFLVYFIMRKREW